MKTISLLAPLLALPLLLSAQNVPQFVNYQGQLANPDGTPLATGNYELTFKIFTAATGGSLVWGPEIFDGTVATGHGSLVPVVQGSFNVLLGPADTGGDSIATAFNGTNRFIQVTVTNHSPILPRQQILTTPFAFQSVGAYLSSNALTANLASNVVNGIAINSAAISSSSIASSTITGSTISGSALTSSTTVPAASLTGTIAEPRLPANAALLEVNQTFTGVNSFNNSLGVGTNDPSAPFHVFSTSFPQALFDGSSIYGSWIDLRDSAGGTNWHIISSGTGNSEGAGKLLFSSGPAPGTVNGDNLVLTPSGNVGIGTSSPATALHVVGTNYGQLTLQYPGSATSWSIFSESGDNVLKFYDNFSQGYFYITTTGAYNTSDRRLKKDIAPLGSVLDRTLKLEPVTYRLKNASESSRKAMGFIAQDVEPLFPELVNQSDGMLGLAYPQMVTVAIGAVQDLNQKVDSENARLRDQLKQQAAENAGLRARVEKLEHLLTAKLEASR